jgi:protein Mpv17
MASFNFGPLGGRGFPWRRGRPGSRLSSGAGETSRPSYFQKVSGLRGPLKAALTSGSLSASGDLLAQFAVSQFAKSAGKQPDAYDPSRTARMFGFGFAFYGPFQFYWYNLLDWLMPLKSVPNFLAKVTANQLVLAPITLSTVFAWNLCLTGKRDELRGKLRRDLLPTMLNGWKFWVPAATLNFSVIPLEYQVLYMSCCGVLWTAYLSYASSNAIAAPPAAPPAPAAKGAKGAKGR